MIKLIVTKICPFGLWRITFNFFFIFSCNWNIHNIISNECKKKKTPQKRLVLEKEDKKYLLNLFSTFD